MWIASVSAPAFCTSACLAARLSGDFERSDQAFQKLASWALMPVSPGSASASSAVSSASVWAFQSFRLVFWPRNCRSRN